MATCSTQSGFVDSWQRGKSVTECNLHMLETEDFTDVTFLVGSEKHLVRAHRYVLASRSCVFHAMFCGRMAEQGEIIIPDIEVSVFRDFLRFLYTDTCAINSENVAGILYTSRKYDVDTLFTQSTSFLEESLSEENLCEILEKSHGYGETDLEQKALEMLSKACSKIVKSAGFLELCSGCFGTFLKSENLDLKEEEIFEAALSWTKAECKREGLNPSHENLRKILGEMVYEIRFASLSLEFMAEEVRPCGILTDTERVMVMDSIVTPAYDISPFKSDMRKNKIKAEEQTYSAVYHVNRFMTILQPSYQDRKHALVFSANKDIILLGCHLYGSDTELTTRLDIELFNNNGSRISYLVRTSDWTLDKTVNDIMFRYSVAIQAGRVYILYVAFDTNLKCNRGSRGVSTMNQANVEFTFFRRSVPYYNSSVEEGQIPGLIWRY